ncbi:unnamed protein product [Prorocentrum cordatum]|uniref:Uncharacterized protein n=1 Tax=Prorocentrum cordatum TaxID=2364126 RepID=A0ABN9Q367_9DINO|nr:unnamed protein product [Polarella glacialis]
MAMSCEADTVVDMIYKPEINVELPDTRMNAKGMEAVGPKTSPETGARHPLEKLLVDNAKRAEQQEMMAKSVVFGQHAPIRAKMERELMAQFQRLPGLPSSMMGLETVLGLDTTIEWEAHCFSRASSSTPRRMSSTARRTRPCRGRSAPTSPCTA